MIFRAPAGHLLISKKELDKVLAHLNSGETEKAKEYLNFCWEEIQFYDGIRRDIENKKMLEEEGSYARASMLEHEIRTKTRMRVERSKLFKDDFLV